MRSGLRAEFLSRGIPFAVELSFSRRDTFHDEISLPLSVARAVQSFLRLGGIKDSVGAAACAAPEQREMADRQRAGQERDRKMEAEGVGKSFVKPLSETSGRARTPVTADH